jgi:hypothetical protein
MLVAMAVYAGDFSQLLNNLEWIKQLGGCREHDAVIVADADMEARQVFTLKEKASSSFRSVEVICSEDSVSGWPQGPNSLFLAAARFAKKRNVPWLFFEPDAIPLKQGWLDSIQIHYQATGAKYMGALVKCEDPRLPKIHLAGVAVYPPNAYDDTVKEIEAHPDKAFDISTAPITVQQSSNSDLWNHLWGQNGNPPTFAKKRIPGTGTFDLDSLSQKAVLYHRNKDGTLIELLRNRSRIEKTFIQLGRFGDIILLLPALKYIHDTTGIRPRLIVSNAYASVLDGVSYVEPVSLKVHWSSGMTEARKYADDHFGGGIVTQCVSDEGWVSGRTKWPNFMVSMIDRTGIPRDTILSLPLVFDRRSSEREFEAVKAVGGRPFIVINVDGISSPLKDAPSLMSFLEPFKRMVSIVDIGKMRCHRIYDLLGVMDASIGGIHIDTSTLHLAHGCKKPYIAITQDGWLSSVPLGNCVLEVKYSQLRMRLQDIMKTVKGWI